MRRDSSSTTGKRSPSFVHLLFVWFLVGSSFSSLGWSVADAVPVAGPVSSMEAGLLFATVVVVGLWLAGFRPSISTSAGYFIAETGLHYLLILGGGLLLFSGGARSPWQEILLRSLSIALAAALVFTDSGRRLRGLARGLARKLVKTPPEQHQ
ncbi:hypothetical protein [Halorussus litoreus]|uniref:hypothetical protein n=1 Tax=Halorussus litoreus TaxID=1710536 RepID=UPI000E27CEDD|nr:hypothetical protein [Halorussus litoreus]